MEKVCMDKEEIFYPASIHHDFPRHYIQETENSIDYITTKYQLTTVLNYDDVQYFDVNMFCRIIIPVRMIWADTFRWKFLVTKKQHCNVVDDTKDLCRSLVKIMSKHGNLNADQLRPGGSLVELASNHAKKFSSPLNTIYSDSTVHDGACCVCCNCPCI
jgi:hypothetical protein